jgi:hypothetical protein
MRVPAFAQILMECREDYEFTPTGASDAEIAWMAALFEGEGCVSPPRGRGPTVNGRRGSGTGLRIGFKVTDLDVLERFAAYCGHCKITGPHKPSGLGVKPTYHLALNGKYAVNLLVEMLPWLGRRRTGQVYRALEAWAEMRPGQNGVKLKAWQIAHIRERLASGEPGIGKKLAREYGVSAEMISHINTGRAWGRVQA